MDTNNAPISFGGDTQIPCDPSSQPLSMEMIFPEWFTTDLWESADTSLHDCSPAPMVADRSNSTNCTTIDQNSPLDYSKLACEEFDRGMTKIISFEESMEEDFVRGITDMFEAVTKTIDYNGNRIATNNMNILPQTTCNLTSNLVSPSETHASFPPAINPYGPSYSVPWTKTARLVDILEPPPPMTPVQQYLVYIKYTHNIWGWYFPSQLLYVEPSRASIAFEAYQAALPLLLRAAFAQKPNNPDIQNTIMHQGCAIVEGVEYEGRYIVLKKNCIDMQGVLNMFEKINACPVFVVKIRIPQLEGFNMIPGF